MKARVLKMDHKEMAKTCFNGTWDLMEKQTRTEAEDLEMLHMAHASVYHWSKVGTVLNQARGEWQVARVYILLGMGESGLFHGKKCLEYCEVGGFKDYDLAFAYEAIYKAYKILNEEENSKIYFEKAKAAGDLIEDPDNKAYFFEELSNN